MAKRAICIGINNYPGSHNDLNGCVNDMNDWAALLTNDFGFDVAGMADDQATADAILSALSALVHNASAGDVLAFTCSSHGSYVLDGPNGDEADNYDETIVAYDRDIIDDEIRTILDRLPADVNLTVISDSCHSGSVTRATLDRSGPGSVLLESEYPTLARYMPKENHRVFDTVMVPRRNRSFGAGTMNHILMTGCAARELSYDAWINNRFNGAMSAHAIAIIRQNPDMTYDTFHQALRSHLPNHTYPQTPQLEGPAGMRSLPIFS